MADTTTSGEISGAPSTSADLVRIARSGSNFKLTLPQVSTGMVTDITWADLLTAIGGSTLTPNAVYHVTTAPDGSTTIDEAWVRAKDANEIFPDGECLVNAANITSRLAKIRFFMAGGVGGKIAGVYDALKNVVEGYSVTSGGTSSTANIDAWLDLLTAANQSVKIYGSSLVGGASGTVGDYSEFIGASVQIAGASNLQGSVLNGASVVLDNAANANGVYVLGTLSLDNGTILANGYVGIGKSLTIADGNSYVGFSTEGNTYVHTDGSNPTGDTVTVAATDGIVYIVDGSTDITVNMPTGIYEGQQMMIFFKNGSAAVTWGGSVDVSFIAAPPAGWRLITFWDATNTTWR